MASYNRVILMGNITRDPELRYLPSNTPVVNLGLAVNERWKNKETGEWQEKANFIDCEAFAATAENINRFFHKGKAILIEGKLRMDQWEDQQGNKRSKLKVVIDRWEFVGARGEDQGGGRQSAPAPSQATSHTDQHQPVEEGDIPF